LLQVCTVGILGGNTETTILAVTASAIDTANEQQDAVLHTNVLLLHYVQLTYIMSKKIGNEIFTN
jgi:hypothetical protein